MPSIEIIGYFLSVIIGLSVGLLGGGGAILAVPMLVYFFNVDAEIATGYSLVIVAISSVLSIWQKRGIDGNFSLKIFLQFGLPSILMIYFTKAIFVPQIPNLLIFSPKIILTKNMFLMMVFSVILLLSSISMLGKSKENELNATPTKEHSIFNIMLSGAFVGFLTGIIGVGGAFVIVPALIFFFSMETKEAIKNSLAIVIANSIVGFYGFSRASYHIDWMLLVNISAVSLVGVVIGSRLNKRMSGNNLKNIFGWMNLILSLILILKEIIFRIYTYKDFIK